MASRDAFVHERKSRWNELDGLLSRGPLHRLSPDDIARVAGLYRDACADLMRARAMAFGTDITSYLDTLVSRGHSALYGPRAYSTDAALGLLLVSFPRTLRRHWRAFAVAAALFYVPLGVGSVLTYRSEQYAMGVLPKAQLHQFAEMYSKDTGKGRDAGTNATMAGFYVRNNVGIAFRCFATGVLFGVGPVFFLVYNGLMTGTAIAFVVRSGSGANILTFICGHSPFELTAIVVSGAAGLVLGSAMIVTGGRTRWRSVRDTSKDVGDLVLGAAVMLLIAAGIEGFWSPSAAPSAVKYAVSAVNTVAITAFLLMAGRERRA